MKNLKILVTGGAGFIGSNLVKKLCSCGDEVRVADNLSRGSRKNLKDVLDKIDLVVTDLTKPKNCLEVSRDVECIFHLAASVGGIHYIKKENVEGSTPSILMNTNMLEAARINDIEKFVFASSACVYQEKSLDLNMFREEDAYPANPATTYGWAKILGEIQCKAYYLDYGIRTSCARIFNAYGKNESLDPKSSHVTPSFIRKAINYPRERFTIFGDGRQERAFLYVSDCVDGLRLFLDKIEDGRAVNLGGEELISINELGQKIISISEKSIKEQHDLKGPQGTHRYCADTTEMKKLLNWKPMTMLDEGLRKTYAWAEKRIEVDE